MKGIFRNIIFLSLIIIAFCFVSCNDVSKSCCEDILNVSYMSNDTIAANDIDVARKCAEKYHKRPEFLQKISQFYYYNAINNYMAEERSAIKDQQSAKELYLALEYMNSYFKITNEIKSYDYQYRAEVYERLGDIYRDINALKQASDLYNNALSDYESSCNNEKELNALLKIGKLYQYNHMPNIAMIYFEMAEEKDDVPNYIYRKIIDNKIVTLYELDDYAKADSIFRNHFNVKIQDYDYHSAIGTKFFYERNYKKAIPHLKYCFDKGSRQEKLMFSEKLAESCFNTDDHENEIKYIQYQAKNNSSEIRKTPLKLDLEKLYDDNINIINGTAAMENKDNSSITLIVVITFFALSISLIIIIFVNNKKKDREKIHSVQKAIDDKKEEIDTKNKIIDDISRKLIKLESKADFEDSYSLFCESIVYKKIKSSLEGVNILTKNVQDYGKLQLSNKDLVMMIKTFNDCFPNAIPSMKKEFEGLTTGDMKFIILNFMNLNNTEIAVLLGLTYGAANKRTNKIKNIFNIKDDLNNFLLTYIKLRF